MTTLHADYIRDCSYPDFVASIEQINTPPGAEETVRFWEKHGQLSEDSRLLDLACTTGYSGQLLSEWTKCSVVGIDVSSAAIRAAIANAKARGLDLRTCYEVATADKLPFEPGGFSHIVAGGCFAFIQNRDIALTECVRVLAPTGILLISNFSFTKSPPPGVLDAVQQSIGFRPSPNWTDLFWEKFFGQHFIEIASVTRDLPVQTEAAIANDAMRFCFQISPSLRGASPEVRQAAFERLVRIRRVLNEQRQWQHYTVKVLQRIRSRA